MPWPYADVLTQGEIDAANNGRLSLMGNNILESYVTLPQWRTVRDLTSGTDYTDNTYFPTVFGCDRDPGTITRPTGIPNGTTSIYYLCNPTTGGTLKHFFDALLFVNHNFQSIPDLRYEVVVASNAAFSTNVNSIFTSSSLSNAKRTGAVSLTNGSGGAADTRFYDVPYLSVRFYRSTGGNFDTTKPQFGELWIGRRRQLPYHPDVPYDSAATESDVVDFVSDGGHRQRTTKSRGRGFFNITTRSGGADRIYGINAATQLRAWWLECDHGTKPSVLFLGGSGGKTDNTFIVSVPDPRLAINALGPFEREASFELIESAPYNSAEQ